MNKIYFISFLVFLLAFAGNGLSQVCVGINKSFVSGSVETDKGDIEVMNAGDNSSDIIAVPGKETLETTYPGVERNTITRLTLSIDGRTAMDITDLLRGSPMSLYLDMVEYELGTQLSYTIDYTRPYDPSAITVNARGASNVKVSRQGPVRYNVTFIVTGEGMVSVKAQGGSTYSGVILGIRIN